MHPELIRLIGKMKYRTSYGQNLLSHSKEVLMSATMAAELGLNPKLAKELVYYMTLVKCQIMNQSYLTQF